jgi:DNA-directed RNA polymerase specialized sigma24 family protein
MNAPSETMRPALAEQSVPELQECCQDEIARYRRNPGRRESVCCREIVLRTATSFDDEVFAALMHVSHPTIRRRCPPDLHDACDDLEQEVAARLFHKFTRAEQPFQVTTFAAYLSYLQITCLSAVQELRGQRSPDASLDYLQAVRGVEPAAPQPGDAVERRMLFERWLDLLADPAMREAFRRRFALDETPEQIAQALQRSKKEVYRLVEQAIRQLTGIPEVREMLEG